MTKLTVSVFTSGYQHSNWIFVLNKWEFQIVVQGIKEYNNTFSNVNVLNIETQFYKTRLPKLSTAVIKTITVQSVIPRKQDQTNNLTHAK